jgi:hypothetical protein
MVTKMLRRLRTPLIGGAAVAVTHYFIFWGSFLVGFGLAMREFDEGPTAWGPLERLLSSVSDLLALPIGAILFRSPAPNLPGWLQHAILAGNSVVWGATAALVLWALGRASRWRVH